MYGLRGVVGTSREALQYWVLPVDWLEYGGKQIKLGLKYPWWGGNRYVSRGREGVHVKVLREGLRADVSIHFGLVPYQTSFGYPTFLVALLSD